MVNRNIFIDGFALVSQPVAVITKECIEYMNPSAIRLAGRDLTGAHASMLFPSHVLNVQADCFATTAFIGKKSCAVSITSDGKSRICVMAPKDVTESVNSMIFAKLRSALTNIRFASSCISIIGENNNDEKLLSYVCSLNRSYNSIKRCIDNMTTLDLLAKGELPFSAAYFDVTEVCSNIINTLKFMLKSADIEISLHAEDHIHLVADKLLFEQALMNLLSNSVAHCNSGCRISVSLLRTDSHLVFGVSDNGSGIEANLLPDIFEKYRHPRGLTDTEQGSGMGLAIVRGIAELHGGAVIIESRGKDKGTSVRVMLSTTLQPSARFSDTADIGSECETNSILTQFSDILPDSCYSNLADD